jgi:hypothetical protein
MWIANDIAGNERRLAILNHPPHRAFRRLSHAGVDRLAAGLVSQAAGEVDNRTVGDGNLHGQAIQFALQLRQDLTNGAGGPRRGRDDVHTSGTAATKVFMWHIGQTLIVGIRMYRAQKRLPNAKGIVQELDDGAAQWAVHEPLETTRCCGFS